MSCNYYNEYIIVSIMIVFCGIYIYIYKLQRFRIFCNNNQIHRNVLYIGESQISIFSRRSHESAFILLAKWPNPVSLFLSNGVSRFAWNECSPILYILINKRAESNVNAIACYKHD